MEASSVEAASSVEGPGPDKAHLSFSVPITNMTTHTFKRTDMHLDHGIWSHEGKDVPPETITAATLGENGPIPGKGYFSSESDGLLTGTEGSCDYVSDKKGADGANVKLHFHWSNPEVGSNTWEATIGLPLCVHSSGGKDGKNIWMPVEIRVAPC
jgi:hypothetical protein